MCSHVCVCVCLCVSDIEQYSCAPHFAYDLSPDFVGVYTCVSMDVSLWI